MGCGMGNWATSRGVWNLLKGCGHVLGLADRFFEILAQKFSFLPKNRDLTQIIERLPKKSSPCLKNQDPGAILRQSLKKLYRKRPAKKFHRR